MSLKVGDLIPIGGKGGDLLFANGLQIEGALILNSVLSAEYTFVSRYSQLEQGTTFQWFRGEDRYGEFTEIEGATNKEYTVVEDDVDNYIKVEVTVRDSADREGWVMPMWSAEVVSDTGFIGEVPASEMFTASEIASACGISQGTPQFENEPWLKFAIDGKIIYRPRKAIRHTINYNTLDLANCVYGGSEGKRVTKNGQTYIVRLMKGALTDPALYNSTDRGAKGSEWNRLMLPIHEKILTKDWYVPAYIEDDLPVWSHNFGTGINGLYSDNDLMTDHNFGRGAYAWCQETIVGSSNERIIRGYSGVGFAAKSSTTTTHDSRGWVPVLEVIK